MRSVEDKNCYNLGPAQEILGSSSISFEFHHRTALGKPTPSKWDDAEKWLVGFSKDGGRNQSSARNSNAEDRRLIAPFPQKERDFLSNEEDGVGQGNGIPMETKKVDYDESIWGVNKGVESSTMSAVRSICVRDMGTEMTPIGSQEPSRTATPVRALTPAARSPMSSGSSTPVRVEGNVASRGMIDVPKTPETNYSDQSRKLSALESRAVAWDEAERAKYMARFKREEVKIQAWENHEKRKAEMKMKKMEVKAERLKGRALEKFTNKIAVTRRVAEEKRANAEAKLSEKAVQISQRADYIRRTGHLPSSFSLKLPSLCW